MDGRHFDAWTRDLTAGPVTRRVAARLLAGTALGTMFARPVSGEVGPACVAHDKPCKGDGGCCSGHCEKNGKCSKRGRLTGKCRCRCPQGTTLCGNKSCCAAGQSCQVGQCTGSCVPDCTDQSACADDGCSSPCPGCGGGQTCQGGACACPPTAPHFCGGTCRECCVNDDCGRFTGKICDHTQGSICICANGNHDCGGGLCVTCCATEHCARFFTGSHYHCTVDGGCACDEGYSFCNGPAGFYCTDTQTDPANCGGCSAPCPPSSVCVGGICANP